ncbi:putative RNA recognition motif domain, nucleotide-binding alpha-beta plait domain superfamily [Helianthus anomalus]
MAKVLQLLNMLCELHHMFRNIFIGGLAKDTTIDTFVKYFGKYGDLTGSVIMNDRQTGRSRGFGFVTYADPSVFDTVIAETHVISGKQVEEDDEMNECFKKG